MIFAKAGLERLDLLPSYAAAKAPFGGLGAAIVLDWMIPAPAQGIVGIVCRDNDEATKQKCAEINNQDAFIAGYIERQFLRTLLGGCSVPISALAVTDGDKIKFKGAIHSFDGNRYFIVEKEFVLAPSPLERAGGEVLGGEVWKEAGQLAADELLSQAGAKELLEEIKNKKWDAEGTVD